MVVAVHMNMRVMGTTQMPQSCTKRQNVAVPVAQVLLRLKARTSWILTTLVLGLRASHA
jgi:hypothetical protein